MIKDSFFVIKFSVFEAFLTLDTHIKLFKTIEHAEIS